MPIYRLENTIQNYAWGSTTAIAELLGQPSPSPEPQAELWMGTHPKGPSYVVDGQDRMPLKRLIEQHPVDVLGRYAAERFDNALPYLFKVLAASRPLSIQAHPSKSQAVNGFKRENHSRKAVDAPDRNYRDDNHKPEIICALTPFWGLNGFRSAASAARLLAPVCPASLHDAFDALTRLGEQGLRVFFESMITLSAGDRDAAVREVRDRARKLAHRSPVYRWIADLAGFYPKDMSVLSPALLNLVCLQPGQAMYLPAGQLHAYLDGVGIELMANSDNVLRGGLTSKHVELSELLHVVHFVETPVRIIEPVALGQGASRYPCPAEEFDLAVIQVREGRPYAAPAARNVEMLLCTWGEGRLIEEGGGRKVRPVKKGDSFLVPANLDLYVLRGAMDIYKAAVPPPQR